MTLITGIIVLTLLTALFTAIFWNRSARSHTSWDEVGYAENDVGAEPGAGRPAGPGAESTDPDQFRS
jgi:hypothetical protein